jgi:hypothetical protein
MIRRLARKPLAWVVVAALVTGGAFGLYWFAPWKLFTSKTVNEALPAVDVTSPAGPVNPASPTPAGTASGAPAAGNVLLAAGQLITH